MFTLLLGLVVITIGLILAKANKEWGFLIFCACIASIIVGLTVIISYTAQLSDFTQVKQTQNTIRLFMDRRDNLAAMVKAELAKYPEYEKKIIGNITPQILLQFPHLKSNETIMQTVESIVKLEDDVYKLRANLITTLGGIYWREFSPWTAWFVTPYEKFFGEKNPVAMETGK